MRFSIPFFASGLALGALVVSCGSKPAPPPDADSVTDLTVNELAALQDFHAWKLAVPQSQEPISRVKLVLLSTNGTSVQLFGTAYTDPAPAWTNILVGFRYEGGKFDGRLMGHGPRMGDTYSFSFTNASTEHLRSWFGASRWNGDHADLATFWNSAEAGKNGGGNNYSTLAIQLVK